MIRYLAIRNLAVIESVAVEFEPSFNILTGETGAGKSILVEAVGLLLGGRAAQDLLRTGEDLATVEAIFDTPDGAEVIVRREITAQGRSRAFINGALATAGALKELANRLVELHGQHEHQQLLDPSQHLLVLDEWAQLGGYRDAVAGAYARVQDARQRIDRVRMDARERVARLELVEFQLAELTRAALVPDEDETLAAERQILRSADRVLRLCQEAYAALYDNEPAVLSGLEQVWKRVGELATFDARFTPYAEARDAIKAQLEDLAFTLRDFPAGIDASPGRLQEVEDRLALLERLKRKHGPTLADVIARRDELATEHAALAGGEASLAELEAGLSEASAAYWRWPATSRRGAPPPPGGWPGDSGRAGRSGHGPGPVRGPGRHDHRRWAVDRAGLDQVEFFFSANLGEDPRPLARIASGGELSRVMLALKTLSAQALPHTRPAGRSSSTRWTPASAGGWRRWSAASSPGSASATRCCASRTSHRWRPAAGRTSSSRRTRAAGGRSPASGGSPRTSGSRSWRDDGGASAGTQARAGARELLEAAQAKGESESRTKAKGESPRGRKSP